MVLLANAPALFAHIIMPTISVATGIGMIAAGITLGVIVSRHVTSLTNLATVLQSEAMIVLNRDLQQNELALFYNALETVDVVIENVKEVLKDKFGKNFVNVELITFSPTPEITSNNMKSFYKEFIDWPIPTIHPSKSTTETIPITDTDIIITAVKGSTEKTSTHHSTTSSPMTKESTTTTRRSITTSTPPPPSPTTTITQENTTDYPSSSNGTTKSSIIRSKLYLYFTTTKSQTIEIENIIAALKTLTLSITVYTVYKNASTHDSSYNSTLSKVEPPAEVNVDLAVMANQPSASPTLLASIDDSARQAELQQGIIRNSTSTNSTRIMYG